MDNRERDLLEIETKLKIFNLDEDIDLLNLYKNSLFPLWQEKSIFILFSYFQKINSEKVNQFTFNEIKDLAQKILKNIISDNKYILLLTIIIFCNKTDAFSESNINFLKNIIKEQIKNLNYNKNTNDGYLASEYNIILLRLYNLQNSFSNEDLILINQLIEKQKEFNTWVINYLGE